MCPSNRIDTAYPTRSQRISYQAPVSVGISSIAEAWRYEQCQFLEPWSVSPAFPKSSGAEGHQNSDRKHLRIAFGLCGGMIEERADTGILFMHEVPKGARQQRSDPKLLETLKKTYTRSSDTLCSPEGSDLYSTTPSTSTIHSGVSIACRSDCSLG